eukprot:TRINITY_DN5621_c0_g1_i2.p1 TRINITY_DN5621_c0_g1~~TRINITY_DN5621_c0_g1_i2.p1  ORF type:complete len:398 (+),score=78.81 TRINITY_DN5621_c0_g1_i2:602-1795(+)
MLHDDKMNNFPDGYPLICINGIEALAHHKPLNELTNLFKFLDFCVYAADNQLAHVFFITTYHFAKFELDKHDGWRHRREFVDFPYIPERNIKKFLSEKVNSYFQQVIDRPLSEIDIEHIVQCVGGSMTDVNAVINNFLTGYSCYDILDRMVADSVNELSEHMTKLLRAANEAKEKDAEEQLLKKYKRFWQLMEVLSSAQAPVPRIDLINQIFHQSAAELDEYEMSQLISYFHRKFAFRNRFRERLDKEEDPHDDAFTVSNPNSAAPKIGLELLKNRVEDVSVLPGSPRMKMAFKLVMSDPKILEQNKLVNANLKKKKLKSQANEFHDTLHELQGRKKDIILELDRYLSHLKVCETIFGREEVNPVINELWLSRKSVEDQMDSTKIELEHVEKEISAH